MNHGCSQLLRATLRSLPCGPLHLSNGKLHSVEPFSYLKSFFSFFDQQGENSLLFNSSCELVWPTQIVFQNQAWHITQPNHKNNIPSRSPGTLKGSVESWGKILEFHLPQSRNGFTNAILTLNRIPTQLRDAYYYVPDGTEQST